MQINLKVDDFEENKIIKTEENLHTWIIIEEIEDTITELTYQKPPD